ncbi:class F sortase [Streptomyces sp. NPDC002994]|uniref:class F sortase n=1 Tax=Streptomyces sp. NPDC002994 TaxID=3154441 RepID=UPI0033ABD1FF
MAGRRLAAGALAAGGLGAMAAGWVMVSGPQFPLGDAGTLPAVQAPAAAGGRAPASPPQSIRGPGRFKAGIVPVAATADGVLALPEEPDTGGWWALGAAPGAPRGTVLVAGHVDTREGELGTFALLHEFPLGARVVLTGADGRARAYRVTARRTYGQEALPADLFNRDGPPRLALITCAGRYDHTAGRYLKNLVLYAMPTP